MTDLQNLDYCNQTISLKKNIEKNFLLLGENLKNIRDAQLFYPQWEDFSSYCWELDLSDATASKLINIYEIFVLTCGISSDRLVSSKGWAALAEALPLIKSKEDAEKYLHLRDTLRSKDYRDTIRAEKRGTPMDTCTHANNFLCRICRDCGYRYQEHEAEHEKETN